MTVVPYQPHDAVAAMAYANGQQVQQRQLYGLCSLFHGFQKAGKSSVADTGPRPRVTFDVESAAQWTPSRKVFWDPRRQTVPQPDGSWDTCVVHIHDFATLDTARKILESGHHPFSSLSVDSVPAIQDRVMEAARGYGKMERDDWGALLRQTTQIIWKLKDLLTHPTHQLWAVTFVCGTHFDHKQRKYRPRLAGGSADAVPFIPDLEGWVWDAGNESHRVWIGPSNDYETGNRLWHRLPDDMVLGYPGMVEGWTIESMVAKVLESQR